MALTTDDIAEIETVLAGSDQASPALAALRRRFPSLAITRCDAHDVADETPFRAARDISLYLVDGSDHCWRLTGDPGRATGLVIVQHPPGASP